MKGLGFVKSILLHTQQDRIGPYLANMIFISGWPVCFQFQTRPDAGACRIYDRCFSYNSACVNCQYFSKISMHAIGCGGMLGIFIIIMNSNTMLMTWPLSIALLITGLVCTSRLIVSNHTSKEIYLGLVVGLICQFAAAIAIL